MNAHPIERLSEYLDETLSAAERARVASHLETCAECRAVLDDLTAVVATAHRLESPAPAEDLWPAIAPRLEPREAAVGGWGERLAARLRGMRLTLSLPQLAAASLALVAISGGVVWWALQRQATVVPVPADGGAIAQRTVSPERSAGSRDDETGDTGAGTLDPDANVADQMPSAGAPRATLATFDESKYDTAVAELMAVLRSHRDQLDPATVQVLEENLAIIDRATEQARKALLADPGNPYLNTHLAEQLKRKVRLLQRATQVVAAHG